MATMKQVQRSLTSDKLILCNEKVDVKVGTTSKFNKANGGVSRCVYVCVHVLSYDQSRIVIISSSLSYQQSVFVNAYVVPEEVIGVKWLLNSDRSPEFQNTLANQLTDLDFADSHALVQKNRRARVKGMGPARMPGKRRERTMRLRASMRSLMKLRGSRRSRSKR